MKTIILYYSMHHGNTKKLADAIAAANSDVELVKASEADSVDLSSYDLIGLASGVYAGNLGKPLLKAMERLPEGKDVFLLVTSSMKLNSHLKEARRIIAAKGCKEVGMYRCIGYDTFGPFKLVGGVAKGHPDEDDCSKAVEFYNSLIG